MHERLGWDVEFREVDRKIRESLSPDFDISVAMAAQRAQLQQILLDHVPDIVHFSGHGDSKRGIYLEDEYRTAAPVDGKALADLFSIIRGKPSIVVLNACSTKRTARAFQNIVDYTIAMNRPIVDIAAIEFASAFYRGLARDLHVPAAFAAGLAQLRLMKLPSKTVPELFIAAGVKLQTPAEEKPVPEEVLRVPGATVSIAKNHMKGGVRILIGNDNTSKG
ncbi:MAG: hypothetical protein QOH21_158 [Acidobacteriota bacterium]|nr:hypothetical protein [Acidobacteriota bacterium]